MALCNYKNNTMKHTPDDLFHLKGKAGLFFITNVFEKVKRVQLLDIKTNETFIHDLNGLIPLKNYAIHLNSGERIDVMQCFLNIYSYIKDSGTVLNSIPNTITEWMNIAAPDYDKDMFKDYHMRKILRWYYDANIHQMFESMGKDKQPIDSVDVSEIV